MPELIELTKRRRDDELLDLYFNHDLHYVSNGGSNDLRQDIARVVYCNQLSAENILVFPGGQVALQTAAYAFASDHTHSIVFTPGYQSTVESPEWATNNAGVTQIPRNPDNNWQIEIQRFKEAIRPNTKFVILNEPWNPGGIVMSHQAQLDIIDVCRQHGIVILCDEVYRLLEHDESDRLPAMANVYEKGISAVTMSKPWGACGVTIGWLACQDLSMIQRLIDIQYFGTACVSRASEIQARMILAASDEILKQRHEIILCNKALLMRFVEKYSDFFSLKSPPNAGAIAFVKFKLFPSHLLGEQLASNGISIKPYYCFAEVDEANEMNMNSNHSCETYYFRVGFGELQFPSNLNALAKFVDERADSWRGK
jgi:aspartate/methionine/tyrosine aminotransferase